MSSEPVDAIDAVNSVSNKQAVASSSPAASSSKSTQSDYLYTSNYVLEVMKLTNLAMEHQAQIVELRGELASCVTQIQSDLSTINQFMSKMQSEAHAGSATVDDENGNNSGTLYYSPNSMSGFNRDFYAMNDATSSGGSGNDGGGTVSNSFGGDAGPGCVSADYQGSMQGFLTAFKQLFYCSPTGSGTTVADLSKISNPYGKDFDMTSFWGSLQPKYASYGQGNFQVISQNPSNHPSLLQQYMYYQAQVTVGTASKSDVKAAGGDISKIPGIDFDPTSASFDPTLGSMLPIITSLNQAVTVQNTWSTSIQTWTQNTTGNVLDMILQNSPQLYNTFNGNTSWSGGNIENGNHVEGQGQIVPGLYCAFAYMAYNYIWTKNPNTDLSAASSNTTGGGTIAYGAVWYGQEHAGVAGADTLSTTYMNTNSTQSTLSSDSSNTNTNFQQDTSSLQTENNAAQQIVTGFGTAQAQMIQNWKSA